MKYKNVITAARSSSKQILAAVVAMAALTTGLELAGCSSSSEEVADTEEADYLAQAEQAYNAGKYEEAFAYYQKAMPIPMQTPNSD